MGTISAHTDSPAITSLVSHERWYWGSQARIGTNRLIELAVDVDVATAWPRSVLIAAPACRFSVLLDLRGVRFEFLLLDLVGRGHHALDLGTHVGHADHDETSFAGIEVLAELLEVLTAHAGCRVPGERTERGTTTGCRSQQSTTDRRRRNSATTRPVARPTVRTADRTDTRRCLVLLDDLDLAVVRALDDRGVICVEQTLPGVEVVDRVVVGLGIVDARVHPDIRHERVHCHVALLRPVNWLTTPS